MSGPAEGSNLFYFTIYCLDYIINALRFSDEKGESTVAGDQASSVSGSHAAPSGCCSRKIIGHKLAGCRDMWKSRSDSSHPFISEGRKWRIWAVLGILLVSGIAGSWWMPDFSSRHSKVKTVDQSGKVSSAVLVTAVGTVWVRRQFRSDWQELRAGDHLVEGDLIQTVRGGSAYLKYANESTVSIPAQTVFTVRSSGDGQMDISAPPDLGNAATGFSAFGGKHSGENANKAIPRHAGAGREEPYLELERIIPFGRSLELIGKVDAGTSLVVNDVAVEVEGDGSFKHFTSPFPASRRKALIVMKATNLAGKKRTLTATHDFDPHDGDN